MFEVFNRLDELAMRRDRSALSGEWSALVNGQMARPWTGKHVVQLPLAGHVPYADFASAFATLHEHFEQKGVYVWGAWRGAAARPQYIGIAGISKKKDGTLQGRFNRRYLRGPDALQRITWAELELNLASAHAVAFKSLADDWAPLRKRRWAERIQKYQDAGITLPRYKRNYGRLPRAERYAKVGLNNLWYFLIPAPPGTTGDQLSTVECELVAAANAELHRLYAGGDVSGIPLLNIDEVEIDNPYVGFGQKADFARWLDGPRWWGNGWSVCR